MRKLLLFLFIFPAARCSMAQTSPQIITGFFAGDLVEADNRPVRVSPDGSKVLFTYELNFSVLDLTSRSLQTYKGRRWHRLSPDFSYAFMNMPFIGDGRTFYDLPGSDAPSPPAKHYSFLNTVFKPDSEKMFRDTNFIVGMDNENRLIVSRAWKSPYHRLGGLEGLWLVDPQTLAVIKKIRGDTIFNNRFSEIFIPRFDFNSSYTALLRTKGTTFDSLQVFPFGSDSVITTPAKIAFRVPITADEHFIYSAERTGITVYSLHSGRELLRREHLLGKKDMPYAYRRCLYAFTGNRVWHYDREDEALAEEIIENGKFKLLRTRKLAAALLRLADDQQYEMLLTKGGLVLFVPMKERTVLQNGNEALLADPATGTLILKIAPFYNPAPEYIAARAKQESERVLADSAQKNPSCADKQKASGIVIGMTVKRNEDYAKILSYDCAKNLVNILLSPKIYIGKPMTAATITGSDFKAYYSPAEKQMSVCTKCRGAGKFLQSMTTSRTKEVPQGYFSGIETKVTRSVTRPEMVVCDGCNGRGCLIK